MILELPGYQIGENLYEGERTLVYRGVRLSDSLKVAIKFLRNSYPSFTELLQFRHQYAITKNLNHPGIVQPLSLESVGNGYALIMKEEGAISLNKVLVEYESLDLESCFKIAIQLASILQELEQQRVIHKDIKPANILIHPESQQIQLIDFSIASLLPKEVEEIKNYNVLEGTLAYISPEQTGRMNRAIDYRSDFYSLGVTLYQLLTGTLPFTSKDPIELVHCHISQQPVPPSVRNPVSGIPLVVSQIVMKLLAKNAEDRYQSGLGLKFDLENCLQQWQEMGKIEAFELATRDIGSRFLIPEKLYGRESEVQTLLKAFDRVSKGQTEMMLVAGFSGIGKTAVINEVHKSIVRERGYFIKGKFDQFQRNIPFSAFVSAFRDLMKQLLGESDAQLAQWQTKILAALGENAQVIIEVIPELELIIGKQPAVPELSGTAVQNRFNRLFQKFIQVFTTEEHPLAIFIDDLQWADAASLKSIKLLMSESETDYLLLLGAYRDNEVSPTHPLMLTLEEIAKSGVRINTIALAPLTELDLNCLVENTLSCSQQIARPLTELVYQKTQGNPFFATQFLKGLHEDGLISFDRDLGYWHCYITRVRQLTLTSDVVEFMATELHKLPEDTQEVLKLAACIGNPFDLETLSIVSEREQTEVAASLWRALQEGLVLPLGQTYKFFPANQDRKTSIEDLCVGYKFLHDRVQQAAYSLIHEKQKQGTHLRIGRQLLACTPDFHLDERIFDIVNQINLGLDLITQLSEKYQLAKLNWVAAKKAKLSTAYAAAYEYIDTSRSLLSEEDWHQDFEFVRSVFELASEIAYLNGDFKMAEVMNTEICERAIDILDKTKAYEIKIQIAISEKRIFTAIESGLEFLDQLDIKIPKCPDDCDIERVLFELDRKLDPHSIGLLKDLPISTDARQLAAMRILSGILNAAYLGQPNLLPIIIAKQVELSINYGNTDVSCSAYANYGLILCSIVNDIDLGFSFGNLALNLLERIESREFHAKTIEIVCLSVQHWKKHINTTLSMLIEAYQIGLELGDFESAAFAAYDYCAHSFVSGLNLIELEKKMLYYSQAIEKLQQTMMFQLNELHRQMVLNLIEGNKPLSLIQGKTYDEEKMGAIHQEENHFSSLALFYIDKLFLCYLFGNSSQAIDLSNQVESYLEGIPGQVFVTIFYFYASLSWLDVYHTLENQEKEQADEKILSYQNKMEDWANHAPMNYAHKFQLISAEKHRVLNQKLKAIEHYDLAIAGAKENGYIQEEALANELAAKFYLDWGKQKVAIGYMTDAYYGYARWGAKAKIDQLERTYPQLLSSILQQPYLQLQNDPSVTSTLTQTTGLSSSKSDFILDWATAMKASQSLSSEMHLDKLVSALMRATMENAGADGGILLLRQPDGWQMATRYAKKGGQNDWDLCCSDVSEELEIPMRVINKVKRSKEAIIVNNFSGDLQFAGDPYLQQEQPLSFLCAPILNQGQLIGILYLENYLAIGAFNRDRVELLSMLCSQAAISLENARLYEQSQDYAKQSQDYAYQLEQSLEDLQQAQLQLVQSEKMSALGNLMAGVAHEINNPVGFIAGNIEPAGDYLEDLLGLLELYEQEYPHPSEIIQAEREAIDLEFLRSDLPQLMDSMQEGTDRIRHISRSLRTFSRTDKEYKVPFNLHEGIESTLLILKHRLKANDERPAIAIVKDYGELPEVECFPGQLNQVFMNLIANAIDALDEGNQGRSFDEIANQIKISTSATAQEVTICIADNGMGMPDEVKERIFEQGFTTKAVGKGTGLGMAIAKSIVEEKHGGAIICNSELGKGTELVVSLSVK
ncbi:AAA family ATPase [Roseofilum sp. Guam]|uniref:trifunctional serine/threonine-protein kinase/ATP-binding protein/sensor histidine kinase n=1 Tax=Roseofilum sp. Guam TaxID=2821502 RepID=UPI001B072CB6|nr:AAA family ATPase [Roseofilum sp. Guam]MBP0030774.1 AAA family ATPase [Roseofilum sp. Guam]